MSDYESVFSHAYTALNMVNEGIYKNEQIISAYDCSFFDIIKNKA